MYPEQRSRGSRRTGAAAGELSQLATELDHRCAKSSSGPPRRSERVPRIDCGIPAHSIDKFAAMVLRVSSPNAQAPLTSFLPFKVQFPCTTHLPGRSGLPSPEPLSSIKSTSALSTSSLRVGVHRGAASSPAESAVEEHGSLGYNTSSPERHFRVIPLAELFGDDISTPRPRAKRARCARWLPSPVEGRAGSNHVAPALFARRRCKVSKSSHKEGSL